VVVVVAAGAAATAAVGAAAVTSTEVPADEGAAVVWVQVLGPRSMQVRSKKGENLAMRPLPTTWGFRFCEREHEDGCLSL
jgi:hypothetical protein